MKTFLSIQLLFSLLVASLAASPEKQADSFYERGLAAEERGELIAADHLYTLATRALPDHTKAQAKLREIEQREEPATKLMAEKASIQNARVFLSPSQNNTYNNRSFNEFISEISLQSGIPVVFEKFAGTLRISVSNISFTGLLDEIEKQTGLVRRYERHAVILGPGQVPLSELDLRNHLNKVRTSEGVIRQVEGGTDLTSWVRIWLEGSELYLFCRPENIKTAFSGTIPADIIKAGQRVKFTGSIRSDDGRPWLELIENDQLEILKTPSQPESVATNPSDLEKIKTVDPFGPPLWKSKDGKSVEGEFVGLDGEAVVIKRDGKELTIPFSNLDAESVSQAKQMNEPKTEPQAPAEEAVTPPANQNAPKGITVLKALYGSREQFDKGEAWDVTEIAKTRVKDGRLYIYHTRRAFGDPHPYRAKILKITYLVDGKNAPSGKPFELERPAGQVILGPRGEPIPIPK